jgi:hypothetical protein
MGQFELHDSITKDEITHVLYETSASNGIYYKVGQEDSWSVPDWVNNVTPGFMYNPKIRLVGDTPWVFWHNGYDVFASYVVSGSVGNYTWQNEIQVTSGAQVADMHNFMVRKDSNDKFHVVATIYEDVDGDDSGLFYATNASGGWIRERIYGVDGHSYWTPDFVIQEKGGKVNKISVTCYISSGISGDGVYLIEGKYGSWGSISILSFAGDQYGQNPVVQIRGELYLAVVTDPPYRGTTYPGYSIYRRPSGGSFQLLTRIDPPSATMVNLNEYTAEDRHIRMAADSDGYLHVLREYTKTVGKSEFASKIVYSNNLQGSGDRRLFHHDLIDDYGGVAQYLNFAYVDKTFVTFGYGKYFGIFGDGDYVIHAEGRKA